MSLVSSVVQDLADSYLDLYAYAFDCSEQIASRLMGIVALQPVRSSLITRTREREDILSDRYRFDSPAPEILESLSAPGLPPAEEVGKQLAKDVAALKERQLPDGASLPFFSPFLSILFLCSWTSNPLDVFSSLS